MDSKAGRDRDALVAEKVMGLKIVAKDWPCGYDPECGHYGACRFIPNGYSWYKTPDYVYVPEHGEWPPIPVPFPDEDYPDKKFASVEPIPFYRLNIADAWLVVNKLREMGFEVQIRLSAEKVLVELRKDFVGITMGYIGGWQKSFPEAICLAALAVMEDRMDKRA